MKGTTYGPIKPMGYMSKIGAFSLGYFCERLPDEKN